MTSKYRTLLTRACALFFAFLLCVPTYAVVPSDDVLDMFNNNGIYYYNPMGNFDACNTSSTKLNGNSIEEKIWNFFIDQGFTDAQTAGLIGNAYAETGIEPTHASNDKYWGLFQWGGGRLIQLQNKLKQAGLGKYLGTEYWPSGASENIPEADLDKILQIELEFAMEENALDWKEEIKKSNTPEEAAEIFLVLFERAVGGTEAIEYYAPYAGRLYQATTKRRDYAKKVFEKYSGKGSVVSGASATAEQGDNLSIIGDSITVGSQAALLKKFPKLTEADIDARISRPWSEGITIAQQKANKLKKIVVFALGTNSSSLTQKDIDAAISAIGPDRTIIFTTNYTGTIDFESNNKLFLENAKNNSNIAIADWNSTVSKKPDTYLEGDQVHPNQAGQELFAETIFKAVNSNTNANGCSVSGEFQSLVKAYAWPENHPAPWHDRMPAYAEAVNQSLSEGRYVGGSVAGIPGIDCGGFVTILVQNSGIAPDYNDGKGATDTQESWVKSHNWQLLNSSPQTPVDTSILQAGDVAFSNGHTWIYVGEIEGFQTKIASASYSYTANGTGRAPMAGFEDPLFGNGVTVRWYRSPNFNAKQTTNSFINDVQQETPETQEN